MEDKNQMQEGKNQAQQWTARKLRKGIFVWLQWYLLTVVLSSASILYQVTKSIPGFLPAGQIWSLGLRAGIGIIQGMVGKFVVPFLASKLTWEKQA